MNLSRHLTKALMDALNPSQQQSIARNFVDWLYADRSEDDREEKANRLAPRLKECISKGEIDLRLVLLQHLKQLLLMPSIFRRPSDLKL